MNRVFFRTIFLMLVLSTCSLLADMEFRIEIRSAAFLHSSKLFKEIYGKAGADFQIQASTDLSDCLEVWSNLDWYSKKGRSIGFRDPTRVNIANGSLGINFLYPLSCQHTLYLGTGPSLANIWLENKSHCNQDESDSKIVLGGVVKAGIYYAITDCIFIDLFVDYLYQPAHFETHVDIGGIKTGLGIGAKF